ncbi:phage tail tape measure protein [Desulfobulbus elongatus]|uniref:phage tail tape measure protein n=1 Tax=Desulfobulbus elongatus TaxID=53332 RepID=UPI0006875594|nr:phage tail tape measure protein [Desulfobulbus elongatus]
MAERMQIYVEMLGRSGNLRTELNTAKGAVRSWGNAVRSEFTALRNLGGSVQGKLAALGIGFSAVKIIGDSARLDKSLTRTKQTASATAGEMALLRHELFTMAKLTGQPLEELRAAFDALVQSGLDYKSALETIRGVNIGSAVTGAKSEVLSGGLTVGATAFNYDLSKPGLALDLLDKMTVAGRQGNAELENLSDIFARVGVNAASAGMGFEQALAFIEGLSLIERNPERLATLADSTLRLFTNQKYMKTAQKATGVRFFDRNGERRDAMAIIADIKKQYDRLTTDAQRANFIQKAFGGADLDTQKGMRTFLQGDALDKVGQFTRELGNAGGTLVRDLDEATGNMVDQVGMLKNDLREAADGFVKPMNATLAEWIKWARRSKEDGGAGLSGEDMIKYGAGGGLGLLLLGRYGGMAAKRLFSGPAGLAAGVVQGKAFEHMAGVTPVFVVNMRGSGLGEKVGGLSVGTGAAGAGAAASSIGAPILLAGAAGAGVVGTALYGMWDSVALTVRQLSGSALSEAEQQRLLNYAVLPEASVAEAGMHQGAERLADIGGSLAGVDGAAEMWMQNMVAEMVRAEREQVIENKINMNIAIDQNGRVVTSTSDPNTQATVNTSRRGTFGETGEAPR